jgi:hypothetical protein
MLVPVQNRRYFSLFSESKLTEQNYMAGWTQLDTRLLDTLVLWIQGQVI